MATRLGEDNREAQLLHGEPDRYGIYQLKDKPELHQMRFMGTAFLAKVGLLNDRFDEMRQDSYKLVYTGELSEIWGRTEDERLGAIFEKFNIARPADFMGHSLSVSDIVVLHEHGENSAHYVDSFGFTRLPEFLRGLEIASEQEKELAFSTSDRFISIQETDGGYDYSIMGMDYKVLGGVYDNPDVSIREALDDIVDDLKTAPRYNGAAGNIGEDDELIRVDYDELLEKVESANRIVPENVQWEDAKRMQGQPIDIKASLKERLADKKIQVAGNRGNEGPGKDNSIDDRKEIQ